MPRFDRLAQLDAHAVISNRAEGRKAELDEGIEPVGRKRVAEGIEVGYDVVHVGADKVRHQPPIMQRRAPWHQSAVVRFLPEARDQRAQQQHLDCAHARMGWHFEGSEFEQSQTPGRGVWRIQLVDRKLGAVRVAGEIGKQMTQ